MSALKFLHAADLHLDSAFEALGERAAERRREQRELLAGIVELANSRGCELLLLAGDLLDSGSAYAETGRELCAALAAFGGRVFISPGNHDYYCPASPYASLELPENVHVFRKSALECVELPELGARIWGAGFTDSSCPPLLRGVHIEKREGIVDLCLIHGDVGKPASPYDPISLQDIAESGFDYIALGHVHSRQDIRREGRSFYGWPGCPEGRGFDECGEKGVYLVGLEPGSCSWEFVPTCRRRYEILTADLDRGPVEKWLPENTENDIYRIILKGETDAAPDLQELEERLSGRFYALQLRDCTSLRRDIWEKAGQDSLTGLFLRRMKELYVRAAGEEERRRVTQAVRWGLAALEGGEAVSRL